MNFIHTFYSQPLLKNKFNKYETLIDVIITDYTYSAMCIKRAGYDIILYADRVGYEMLKHIPYDSIKVLNFDESVDFAASIKFEAIKKMSSDDVLIDGDLFMQKDECFDIIKNYSQDFICSFFEPTSYTLSSSEMSRTYSGMLDKLRTREYLFTDPYVLPSSLNDLSWPNTSLMKFNNADLKNEYIRQYMLFKNGLRDIDFGEAWPDIIIEQYNMKSLLATGYSNKYIIENFPTKESNDYALSIGFTHLGAGKVQWNDYFKKKLKEEFNNEYNIMNLIINHFKKNKPNE